MRAILIVLTLMNLAAFVWWQRGPNLASDGIGPAAQSRESRPLINTGLMKLDEIEP